MKLLAKIVGGFFGIAMMVSSILLWFYWWFFLEDWLGFILGTIAALVLSPGVIVFPLIYWFVKRAFPTFYFELLAVSAVSALILGVLHEMND
jgi:hypothetical protein